LTAAIISRLKIMAELDIAERRLPQDGRIRLQLQDRHVDVRVATLPTLLGESVVLRLLDKEHGRIALTDLGMAADTLAQFSRVIARPHGIVLATGPTGSGKTTTLYAAIDLIRTGREKILTVEDPVEYQLTGVPQVAVNDRIGVTFATAVAVKASAAVLIPVVLAGLLKTPRRLTQVLLGMAGTSLLVAAFNLYAFGLHVPDSVPGVPREILDPRGVWADAAAYDRQAGRLKGMFEDYFRDFREMGAAAG